MDDVVDRQPGMSRAARFANGASAAPFDLFRWMSVPLQEAFWREAVIRRLSKGQIVYSHNDRGNSMYRLLSGSVRLINGEPDGRELVYLLFGPGDCFGVSSCIDLEARPQTAEAGSPCEIAIVSREGFAKLRENREFDTAVLHVLSAYVRKLSANIAETEFDDLTTRIAARLIDATWSFGVRSHDGVHLSVRISQAELGLMVGSCRQSVNKVLQRFRDSGLIEIEYGAFVVREGAQLARIAAGAASRRAG